MVTQYYVGTNQVDLTIGDASTTNSIIPMISHRFQFSNRSKMKLYLNGFSYTLRIRNIQGRFFILGFLNFEAPLRDLDSGSTSITTGYIPLDYFMLKKIEEFREDGDVFYNLTGNFIGTYYSQNNVAAHFVVTSASTDVRISKSDWVEKFLPHFDYKEVSLLEIPKIPFNNFEKIGNHLNSAWKQKHMGHYDKVLLDCRKAIEALRIVVRESGFVDESNEKGDKPDWNSLFNSRKVGNIFKKIDQQIWRFSSIGAHTGKAINITKMRILQ